MMMNDPTEGVIIQICDWIATVALLNLLWILFTLLGGIILGWAPATAALFAVWRHRARGDKEVPLLKTMWKEYQMNFFKANGIGLIVLVAGVSLIFYSFTLVQWGGLLRLVFWTIFLLIAFIYTVVLVFIFPVYIHYDVTFFEYFKYALMIGLSHLHFVVIIIAGIGAVFWASSFHSGIYFLFSISLSTLLIMHLSLIVFEKIEDKHLSYSNQEYINQNVNKRRI